MEPRPTSSSTMVLVTSAVVLDTAVLNEVCRPEMAGTVSVDNQPEPATVVSNLISPVADTVISVPVTSALVTESTTL